MNAKKYNSQPSLQLLLIDKTKQVSNEIENKLKNLDLNKFKKVISKLEMLECKASQYGFTDEDQQQLKIYVAKLKNSFNNLKAGF